MFFRQVLMVNLSSLFPYGWEFGNLKLQQLSRYFRNAETRIPACAGMMATAVSDDFYGRMMKFIRKYEKRSSEPPPPFSDDLDIYSSQSCVSSESL